MPALLEAVCSEAAYVRLNAIQWVRRLLVNMDAEAASNLAAHLAHDENHTIAQIAQEIIDITARNRSPISANQNVPLRFLNLTKSDGLTNIQNEVEQRIKELTQRLQISYSWSVVLLLHNKCSVLKAEFEYRNNQVPCLERCALICDENMSAKETGEENITCGICYDEMEREQTYCLSCGHTFGKGCWVSYVRYGSNELSLATVWDLQCPQHECGIRVMMDDLQRLEPCLVPKWNDALLQRFIEEDPLHRYCSGPDCRCVARKSNQQPTTKTQKVTCDTCSTSFCFQCGQNDHAPASCEDMAQ